jgi:hypothetical protein
VVVWEEGLAAFACMLVEVRMERDACYVRADAVQWDFFAHACTSSSRSKQHTDLSRTLEECQILLSLEEADLEVREVILVEELERGLHFSDGRDLSAPLDKVMQLSQCIMGISNALVDLGMLPMQDIPQLLKSAQDVLPAANLILKHWPLVLVHGTKVGMAAAPMTLGHPPNRSSAFFLALRNGCKRCFSIYIHISISIYVYVHMYLLG